MAEKRDKWDEAFAKLAERPRPRFVQSTNKSTSAPTIGSTDIGSPNTYRKGYSVHNSVDRPVDDDRFLGRFGLMDKFLSKVPECVIRGAWLGYFTTKELSRLDIAMCGGMRRRFRQALNGYIIPNFDYDITATNFQWLDKRGIVVSKMRVSRRERNLSFLAPSSGGSGPGSLRWLKWLDLSQCNKVEEASLAALTPGSLPNLTDLDTTHTATLSSRSILILVKSSSCLSSLRVTQKPCVDDAFLSALVLSSRSLTRLDMGGTSFTDAGLLHITGAYNQSLQHLDIAFSFSLSSTSLQSIATCSLLTYLSFENCMDVITDDIVTLIARSCPLLTHLILSGCESLTDDAFLAISDSCHHMLDLGLFIIVPVSAEALTALSSGCPRLSVMGFENTVRLTPDAFRVLISWFPNLCKLQLQHSAVSDEDFLLLGDVHKGRPQGEGLQHLQISCARANTTLTDDGIMSACKACWADLSLLALRDCTELTDASLVTISQYCPKLSTIRVDAQNVSDLGITAIAHGCKMLTEVQLYNAFNITNNGVEELFANCLELRSVVIYGCLNVSTACIWNLATKHADVTVSINNQSH
jgi:hypothetical protein